MSHADKYFLAHFLLLLWNFHVRFALNANHTAHRSAVCSLFFRREQAAVRRAIHPRAAACVLHEQQLDVVADADVLRHLVLGVARRGLHMNISTVCQQTAHISAAAVGLTKSAGYLAVLDGQLPAADRIAGIQHQPLRRTAIAALPTFGFQILQGASLDNAVAVASLPGHVEQCEVVNDVRALVCRPLPEGLCRLAGGTVRCRRKPDGVLTAVVNIAANAHAAFSFHLLERNFQVHFTPLRAQCSPLPVRYQKCRKWSGHSAHSRYCLPPGTGSTDC